MEQLKEEMVQDHSKKLPLPPLLACLMQPGKKGKKNQNLYGWGHQVVNTMQVNHTWDMVWDPGSTARRNRRTSSGYVIYKDIEYPSHLYKIVEKNYTYTR